MRHITRRGVDGIVNLGDNVSAEERGASDAYALTQLGERELSWLRDLVPQRWLDPQVYLCHATPRSDIEYLLETDGAHRSACSHSIRSRFAPRCSRRSRRVVRAHARATHSARFAKHLGGQSRQCRPSCLRGCASVSARRANGLARRALRALRAQSLDEVHEGKHRMSGTSLRIHATRTVVQNRRRDVAVNPRHIAHELAQEQSRGD